MDCSSQAATQQGLAPDCLQPLLVPRSGFRQQVKPGVRLLSVDLMRKAMSGTDEARTIDVFCEHCNVQVAACVVATHVKSTPQDMSAFLAEPTDAPYNVFEYAIAVCGRCESVFLVESEFYEIPAEVSVPQGERVLYPTSRQVSTDGVPTSVARAYSTAARAFVVGLYEPCVIMCRKCIEALCRELGATKGNLKERLVALLDAGQIDQKLLAWADELRLIGNDAAHDLDIVIEQVDARDALDFVEAILLYVFSLSRRFEEFKNRRAANRK